jgi:hypothetical protein
LDNDHGHGITQLHDLIDEDLDVVNAGGRDLPPAPWDLAFHVDRNTFRGNTSVQLLVQALRPGRSPERGF